MGVVLILDDQMILIGIIVVIIVGLLSVRRSREHIFEGISGCFGLFFGCGCLIILLSVFFGPVLFGFFATILRNIFPSVLRLYCNYFSSDSCESISQVSYIVKLISFIS